MVSHRVQAHQDASGKKNKAAALWLGGADSDESLAPRVGQYRLHGPCEWLDGGKWPWARLRTLEMTAGFTPHTVLLNASLGLD